ncbi:MAG: MAPEG family protein [Cyanobacteria bacterium J06634_6]
MLRYLALFSSLLFVMTTDLICLLILSLWSIPLNHMPALGRASEAGLEWAASNREKAVKGPVWVGRADRAQRNHHDNLAMIAAVILIAQVTGQANGITAIAAMAILGCRVLHGVAYIAGITLVRSLAYFGSIIGVGVIAWQVFI